MREIERMLFRKKGCTRAEVRQALGWPSVSIPQRAKQLGIILRTERQGRETRYWAV